jgi:outer membrane receptor protein involved in Fe transport
MTERKTLLFTAAAAALIAGFAMPAMAQDATTEDTAETAVDDEIIVTARLKEETLLEAPVAVTAFGAQQIEDLGLQSINDIARFTPGLSFQQAFGRSSDRPVIRGQANVLATVQAGVEAGAAFFVDGVYYAGDIQSLDLNDIERVEVIKGPQSALYGRNTYSGAINYITRSPGNVFSANALVSAAEDGEYTVQGRVAGPILDNLTGALSARYYTYDGEWTNAATGETLGAERSQSASITLDWTPADTVSIRQRLVFQNDKDGPRAFAFQNSNANNCFPGFRSNAFRGAVGTTNNNPNQYFCGVIPPTEIVNQNTGANGTVPGAPFMGVERTLATGSTILTIDLPNEMTAQALFGFRNDRRKTGSDSDFQNGSIFTPTFRNGAFVSGAVIGGVPTNNALFQLSSISRFDDVSLELRLQSSAEQRLRWLLGAYYYSLESNGTPINFAFGPATGFVGPQTTADTLTNTAVFGRLSYDILDNLTFDAEVRAASETKTATEFGDGLGPSAAASTTTRAVGQITYNDRATFENITPRLTLTWFPQEGTTLYGIYAIGVKPGGLNGLIGRLNNRNSYGQEESTNFELGWKQDLNDGRGSFTFAGYYIEAQDYQLTTTIADITGASATGLTSVVTNQGQAEIWGIEADLRYRLTDTFRAGVNYSYTSPEFTEGCDDFQYTLTSGGLLLGPTPNTPAGVPPGFTIPPGASCSIAGKQIPLTSRHKASADFDWTNPTGWADVAWFLRGNAAYESSRFAQVHNLAETGDSLLVGGRVGFEGDRWSIAAFGRNLTNEDSIVNITRWFDLFQGSAAAAGLTGPAVTGVDTGSPRAFFLSLRRSTQYGVEFRIRY